MLTGDPLAYYTAKTNGLDDTALDILEEAGMTEDDLPPPPQTSGPSTLAPPQPAFAQVGQNWPIKNLGESFFDRALANGADGSAGEPSSLANGADQSDAWAVDEPEIADEDDEAGEDEGWDLDAEVIAVPEEEEAAAELDGGAEADLSEGVSAGVAEDDMWVRNSPLAADHAAAGNFESAMQVSRARLLMQSRRIELMSAAQPPSRGCQLRPAQAPLPGRVPSCARLCARQPFSPSSYFQRPPQSGNDRAARSPSCYRVRL